MSERAGRDLKKIGDNISIDRPIRAKTYVNELLDTAEAIGHQPHAYPPRDDLAPGLREAVHRPYLILFRATATHVEIVRIVHGARNLKRLSFR
jgi:toxin ParE1/3/4